MSKWAANRTTRCWETAPINERTTPSPTPSPSRHQSTPVGPIHKRLKQQPRSSRSMRPQGTTHTHPASSRQPRRPYRGRRAGIVDRLRMGPDPAPTRRIRRRQQAADQIAPANVPAAPPQEQHIDMALRPATAKIKIYLFTYAVVTEDVPAPASRYLRYARSRRGDPARTAQVVGFTSSGLDEHLEPGARLLIVAAPSPSLRSEEGCINNGGRRSTARRTRNRFLAAIR